MLRERIRGSLQRVWRELAKFGVIGAISFVIDLGGFNLLLNGPMAGKVTSAKVVSGAVATAFAWIGNRYWTFRHRRNRPVHHEVALFFIVNAIALGISALWVAFANYVLGFHGHLALNVNAVIGIGLGTLFRFWTYRKFVFANDLDDEALPAEHDPSADRATRLG